MAYAAPAMPVAHPFASANVHQLVTQTGEDREVDHTQGAVAPGHPSPVLGSVHDEVLMSVDKFTHDVEVTGMD